MTLRLGQEVYPAERFIFERLQAQAGLEALVGERMYGYTAPQQAGVYPAIVWQLQAPSTDVKAIGNIRIMVQPVYVVRVIGQGASWVALSPIADLIDAALEGASGTVPGAEILGISRVGPFALVETVNAVQYRHLGGQYRVPVQLQQP